MFSELTNLNCNILNKWMMKSYIRKKFKYVFSNYEFMFQEWGLQIFLIYPQQLFDFEGIWTYFITYKTEKLYSYNSITSVTLPFSNTNLQRFIKRLWLQTSGLTSPKSNRLKYLRKFWYRYDIIAIHYTL